MNKLSTIKPIWIILFIILNSIGLMLGGGIIGLIAITIIFILILIGSKQKTNNKLMSDEFKKTVAEAYYAENKKEADEYINALDGDLGQKVDTALRPSVAKSLVATTIEAIYQSAHNDKSLNSNEWRLAGGFTRGATNLIRSSSMVEYTRVILTLTQFMLVYQYKVSKSEANHMIEQHFNR